MYTASKQLRNQNDFLPIFRYTQQKIQFVRFYPPETNQKQQGPRHKQFEDIRKLTEKK